ncbi:MAG TPA: hypothetical protein VK427_01775 [Kofleriaceae bacterium]|nr:hypothetical protein [Kofleriaceae bacterium]
MRALTFAIVCGCASSTPAPQSPNPPAPVAAANEETFTGTITEANFGCASDASCDLVIDGTKRVHFGHDTRLEGPTVWGDTEQIFTLMEDGKQGVGRRVEVFAAKRGDGYTLQGKAEYYIKVLP